MTDKYQQAVNRATDKSGNGKAEQPMVVGNAATMISEWKPEDLDAIATKGGVEFAPQMMALEPGQKIEGILEGMGLGNDFINEQTGEVRHVDSWIIASFDGTRRISILSSAQLDRKLPPFVGGPVGIARDKDLKAGNGFKVADFKVWGPKLPNNQRRIFHIIEAKADDKVLPAATAPALPAGEPAATPGNHTSAPAAS